MSPARPPEGARSLLEGLGCRPKGAPVKANRVMRTIPWLAVAALAGCVNLAPRYERPALAVPAALPAAATDAGTMPAWQALLRDERLRLTVDMALANNRDCGPCRRYSSRTTPGGRPVSSAFDVCGRDRALARDGVRP